MVTATTTGNTCAANCWYAREVECRCSCGGRNHGTLLVDGAEQPRRNATILGERYVLASIEPHSTLADRKMRGFAKAVALDPALAEYVKTYGSGYRTVPTGERGAIMWVKTASVPQSTGWPEIAAYMDALPDPHYNRPKRRPALLWVRENAAAAFDAWLANEQED